jgi:hypothetical protein
LNALLDPPYTGNASTATASGSDLPDGGKDIVHEIWQRGGRREVGGPTKQELMKFVIDTVSRLLKLAPGWDGKRARRVDPKAAVAMCRLIESLIADDSADPQITPLSDGGLSTEWLVGGASLEIRVTPNLSWSIWAEDQDGRELFDAEFERPGQGRARIEQGRRFLADVSKNVRFRRSRQL